MIALIRWLIFGPKPCPPPCSHRWEPFREIVGYGKKPDGSKTDLPTSLAYVLRCEHCGDIVTRVTREVI